MSKVQVIQQLEEHLREELSEAKSNEDASAFRELLTMYRHLPRRAYGAGDVIVPSALIELQLGSTRTFCLMVPKGGGMVTRVEGVPVQVITPNSPLGEALLGKRVGDRVKVEIQGKTRIYEVISLS